MRHSIPRYMLTMRASLKLARGFSIVAEPGLRDSSDCCMRPTTFVGLLALPRVQLENLGQMLCGDALLSRTAEAWIAYRWD